MSEPSITLRNRRVAIAVRGVVQGVGFRPFVFGLATELRLSGWVLNEADIVRIEVEGPAAAVERFVERLPREAPPQSRIEHLQVEERPTAGDGAAVGFEIRTSDGRASPRPVIPADLAVCPACRAEIADPHQRRFRYPFTNCTNCGPRWSIIERLPYDRPRTSMAGFAMCDDCRQEYEDPRDRRFHAQPVACPACGPQLSLLDADGRAIAERDDALRQACAAILAGQIVALRGLGGFQLLVDATQPEAVARLRRRKHRPHKPLAVLVATLADAQAICEVGPVEAELLQSPAAPIVLLRRRAVVAGDGIADAVAPGNPTLGVMLAYTPLHVILAEELRRPIVCTSGNLSEEPMAIDTDDALRRLAGIADLWLTHNRPIVRPVDDSVVQVIDGQRQVMRRARGFAPLPLTIAGGGPAVLAVGGHLKNVVGLALGEQRPAADASPLSDPGSGDSSALAQPADAGRSPECPVVLSAHVGDLDNALSVAVHRRAVDDLVSFYDAKPGLVACDLHPDYASTRHAAELAERWSARLVHVQHHHAHVAGCVAEHKLEGPVLGFSWDGTGYGTDGTVWGGEVLLCEGASFQRVGHLRPFPLPGGDRAAREPRRSALGVLFEAFNGDPTLAWPWLTEWFSLDELDVLWTAVRRRLNCPTTTSMGRLFDAIAALCGLGTLSSFEGQAAMALQFAADETETAAYDIPLSDATPLVADWGPLVQDGVLADLSAGLPVASIAAKFHNALMRLAVAVARRVGCPRVALTGGCFQNALLSRRLSAGLAAAGFSVYRHQEVPPGDGGVALGQIYVATREEARSKKLEART